MFAKYFPIEKDQSVPKAEKEKHMRAWFRANLDSFSKAGLKDHNFADICLASKLMLRHGTSDMMKVMGQHSIPFLVVSGGISEMIEAHLQVVCQQTQD